MLSLIVSFSVKLVGICWEMKKTITIIICFLLLLLKIIIPQILVEKFCFTIHLSYLQYCYQVWVLISIHCEVYLIQHYTCDKVCQWLAAGQWFSPGTSVSSTNKTDCYDITDILLKVVLNTINQNQLLCRDKHTL